MNETLKTVNKLMVEVFNDILKIEEGALKKSSFGDLSVTEMHTIEAISLHNEVPMSEVAKKLDITVGTLTVAINNLVRKGYVQRNKSEDDRRLVLIKLTNRGKVLFRLHDKFHIEMINNAVVNLSKPERESLEKALNNIHEFFLRARQSRSE